MTSSTTNIDRILDDLATVGMNVFKDDLGTLKTLIISYHYVRNRLKDENTDANYLEHFTREEKVLGSRIFATLKTLEEDCVTQLWLNEDYNDPLLLTTREKTEEIKRTIMYYRWRHVHRGNNNKQLVKFAERLLRKIKRMGVDIMGSETEQLIVEDLNIDI